MILVFRSIVLWYIEKVPAVNFFSYNMTIYFDGVIYKTFQFSLKSDN